MERLEHALLLAAYGFRVFPLRPEANRPLICGWQDAATTDVKQIERWFYNRKNNIGVACGAGSNLTVIDIDAKGDKNGFDALAKFVAEGQTLPPSPIVQSPHGGGRHLYFQYCPPLKNWCGKLGAGIDIKTEGGFVAGPGSHRDGSEYKWLIPPGRGVLPEIPRWVIRKLVTPKRPVRRLDLPKNVSLDGVSRFLSRQTEGTRNKALYWGAGVYRREGKSLREAEAALRPVALHVGLDDEEINRTLWSAFK